MGCATLNAIFDNVLWYIGVDMSHIQLEVHSKTIIVPSKSIRRVQWVTTFYTQNNQVQIYTKNMELYKNYVSG